MGGILNTEKDDNPDKNQDNPQGSTPDREQHIPPSEKHSEQKSQNEQNLNINDNNPPKKNTNSNPKFILPKPNLTDSPNIHPKLVSIIAPIPNKKNKWNFQGDYHNNWEKNLLPINNKMQNDYHKSMITTKYWIRTIVQNELNPNIKFPEYINIIVAEFFVLPRCSSCGKYDNLWLNIGDGFIGCGRKFYALKSMGGNGCSLTHYNEHKNKDINSDGDSNDDDMDSNDSKEDVDALKPGPIAVKLGTISAKGADVFDYDEQGMIFNADDDSDSESDYEDGNKKKKTLTLNDLQQMLNYWGIEMNRMYLYDKTFHSNQSILDDTFSKHSYNTFVNDD